MASEMENSSIIEEMLAKRRERKRAQDIQQPGGKTNIRQWEEQKANLGKMDLDPAGKSELSELNKKSESIRLAYQEGKVNDNELQEAISGISKRAGEFNWDLHQKPPGSNPGDIVTEEGVMKLRNDDGSLEPIAYTGEFIKKNSTPIGDTGNILVPTSPKEGYKIINRSEWDRDAADEREAIEGMHKQINEKFSMLSQEALKQNELFDPETGKSAGYEPLPVDMLNQLSAQASDIVAKQYMQAKDVYRRVMDGGLRDGAISTVREETFDPFRKAVEIREMEKQQEALKKKLGRQGQPPVPSPTPVPAGQPQQDANKMTDSALMGILQQQQGGSDAQVGPQGAYQIPEERAGRAVDPTDWAYPFTSRGKQLPIVQTGGSFGATLAASARLDDVVQFGTKEELINRLADAPAGIVGATGDGSRYVKDSDGEFYQVPWSKEEIESDVMLDKEGEEMIDPNTGEAAPGIVQQLAAGKSRDFSPSGSAAAAKTGPPGQAGTPPIAEQQDRMAEAAGANPDDVRADRIAAYEAAGKPEIADKLREEAAALAQRQNPYSEAGQPGTSNQISKKTGLPAGASVDTQEAFGRKARTVESPARREQGYADQRKYAEWNKDPQILKQTEAPVVVKDETDQAEMSKLEDGQAFVLPGIDKVWVRDGDRYIGLQGTSANPKKTRWMNWRSYPELVEQIVAAPEMGPPDTTGLPLSLRVPAQMDQIEKQMSQMEDGKVFKMGGRFFVKIDGSPMLIPGTEALSGS